MVSVEFAPRANDDVREIWLTIAEDNPEAADRVVAEVKRFSTLRRVATGLNTKRASTCGCCQSFETTWCSIAFRETSKI